MGLVPGELDLVHGGPPCTPYRNQNRPVFDRFIRAIGDAGYSIDRSVLIAADHGVPQLRQRLICVGVRRDLLHVDPALWRLDWPSATHCGPHERRVGWDVGLPPHVTAGEALFDTVQTASVYDPSRSIAGDVKAFARARPVLTIEVKQRHVESEEVLGFARQLEGQGLAGLYAAFAQRHPLDRDALARRAEAEHGYRRRSC